MSRETMLSKMTTEIHLKDTDRLLDELENTARSTIENGPFFDQLLSSLRLLVNSESASTLVRLDSNHWVNVASSGTRSPICESALALDIQNRPHADFFASSSGESWFAVPIQPDRFCNSCLLLTFAKTLPTSGMQSLTSLCRAFADVIEIRQLSRLQHLFGRDWNTILGLTQRIFATSSSVQVAQWIVNQLAYTLKAERVSLTEIPSNQIRGSRILAVSNMSNLDRQSMQVLSLTQIATAAIRNEEPILRQFPANSESLESNPSPVADDGSFKNLLAMKFYLEGNQQNSNPTAIVLEWASRDAMLESLPAITHFLPVLCLTWQQQWRWNSLPRLFRSAPWIRRSPVVSRTRVVLVRMLIGLLALFFGYLLMSRPSTLTIEAEAVLEPIERRAIFANVDGFLDTLFVEDGQNVVEGQPLAKLRSPTLDLQIEETTGQIRAISEKRNGLKVAINQISVANADAVVAQTRISADLLLLEIQEKQIEVKLKFLKTEQRKLEIHSPISGVVVSRDLRKELELRPLRRGDSMFNVANLKGDWQLNIRVADRDSGYVNQYYSPSLITPESPTKIECVFDSLPNESFEGTVRYISSSVENPEGAGCFLLVLANLSLEDANKAHMGAKARVYFHCGQKPIWFVWCRPMIEAIQRRIWPFFGNHG